MSRKNNADSQKQASVRCNIKNNREKERGYYFKQKYVMIYCYQSLETAK